MLIAKIAFTKFGKTYLPGSHEPNKRTYEYGG